MNPEQDRRPDPAPGAAGSVRDVLSDSAREGSVLESSRQHGIGSGRLPSATDMPVGYLLWLSPTSSALTPLRRTSSSTSKR